VEKVSSSSPPLLQSAGDIGTDPGGDGGDTGHVPASDLRGIQEAGLGDEQGDVVARPGRQQGAEDGQAGLLRVPAGACQGVAQRLEAGVDVPVPVLD
jgi:hypothetical protein